VNWKLIFLLTLFGVAMGIAGVIGLRGRIEAIVWLIIFIIYAVIIVKQTPGRYFIQAFIVSVIDGVWIGIIHAIFVSTYLANHHVIAGAFRTLPLHSHRRIWMVILGPVVGAIIGVIAGLVAMAVGKLLKKKTPAVQSQT
jgi:hypothetical protein